MSPGLELELKLALDEIDRLRDRVSMMETELDTPSAAITQLQQAVERRTAQRDEALAEIDRLKNRTVCELCHVNVEMMGGVADSWDVTVNEMARLEGVVYQVRGMLDSIRCLDRDEQGRDRCDRPAIAVAWGTLYSKDQSGPKCAEHLKLRHPNLGALAPAPFNGPHAITWLDGLRDAVKGRRR